MNEEIVMKSKRMITTYLLGVDPVENFLVAVAPGVGTLTVRFGLVISGEPVTFYALQLESVEGSYITEFYLEYTTDGINFIKVQNFFTVPSSVSANMTTVYFTGIYAKAIRIRVSKFQGWPAARIEFFYYDSLRFKKISNLKSLK